MTKRLSSIIQSIKSKHQRFSSPEELVMNTLDCFNLTDQVKNDSSKVNELKKFAPKIEDYLYPSIKNEKMEIQLSLI